MTTHTNEGEKDKLKKMIMKESVFNDGLGEIISAESLDNIVDIVFDRATELERKRIRDNITALSRYEASDVPKGNIVMLAGDIAQVIENCISCPACQTKYLK